jgi:hypothetical protein
MKAECADVPVDEFSASGVLSPTDPIASSVDEECPVGYESAELLGEWGDRIHADLYLQAATGHVLIQLVALVLLGHKI